MASKNSNSTGVPQAKEAMEQFKMQAASEMGVNLKQGYNGDLTSREAGSVGGQMVKNVMPKRNTSFVRDSRTLTGHQREVNYIVCFAI